MNIFDVLAMVGGLAFFLYGMNAMGDGLAKVSGGRWEKILERLTSSPIRAVFFGALVTVVIQSSSATTVMVVGFVNSGIMKLSQAIGIIMGANVGTTVTAWILSLSGIESDNMWLQFLKPSHFSPVLAAIGVVLLLFVNNQRKTDIGTILVGFAILMSGMDAMSAAVKPLAEVPAFTGILTMFSNPVLGVLAGAVLTAVIQSSSASVGILQALCATGGITYGTAFPIIMGQNIGTCVTALLSGIGANKNAKRAALVHLYFNVIGTVVFMFLFYTLQAAMDFEFVKMVAGPAGIAVLHSIFNIMATIILLPFARGLERLAYFSIREETGDGEPERRTLLDERFLEQPAFAMQRCRQVALVMAKLSRKTFLDAGTLLEQYDEKRAEVVIQEEEKVDGYEEALGRYLFQLSSRNLSENDSRTLSLILHCMSDFERISDYAVSILNAAKKRKEKKIKFSEKSKEEIRAFFQAVTDLLNRSIEVFAREDSEAARDIEPQQKAVDQMGKKMKKRYVKRLRHGKYAIEEGLILNDLMTNFRRVAEHCANIGECVIQMQEDSETYESNARIHAPGSLRMRE